VLATPEIVYGRSYDLDDDKIAGGKRRRGRNTALRLNRRTKRTNRTDEAPIRDPRPPPCRVGAAGPCRLNLTLYPVGDLFARDLDPRTNSIQNPITIRQFSRRGPGDRRGDAGPNLSRLFLGGPTVDGGTHLDGVRVNGRLIFGHEPIVYFGLFA